MCGDRKVAIISAILIAIRAPLIVRLFENNRDYLKIIATIFCAKCVRTVNENRTGFLYPIMQGGRSVLDKQWRLLWHQQWAIVGYAHSAHGYAISAQNITTFLKYCGGNATSLLFVIHVLHILVFFLGVGGVVRASVCQRAHLNWWRNNAFYEFSPKAAKGAVLPLC